MELVKKKLSVYNRVITRVNVIGHTKDTQRMNS